MAKMLLIESKTCTCCEFLDFLKKNVANDTEKSIADSLEQCSKTNERGEEGEGALSSDRYGGKAALCFSCVFYTIESFPITQKPVY